MDDESSDEIIVLKICNGRLCLPSSYKESNGKILILTRSVLNTSRLALYTREQWIPILSSMLGNGAPKYDGKRQALTRYVIGNAEDCMVEAGAIQISSHLIKAAGLHSDVIWIKGSNHIGIWNPKAFDEWKQNKSNCFLDSD